MNDRPLGCSNCKHPIRIIYKEIERENLCETHMCDECPFIQGKVYDESRQSEEKSVPNDDLYCKNCGTTYEAIHSGECLGCQECYTAFEELVVKEMIASNRIAGKVQLTIEKKQEKALHVGKSPHQSANVTLSKRLQELHDALNDALRKENYEQAAWLRDQIKEISENPHA